MSTVDGSGAKDIATSEQLEAFLDVQKGKIQPRLGIALLQENVITQKQLNLVIERQLHGRKSRHGEILIAMCAATGEAISRVLSKKIAVPALNLQLRKFEVDPAVIKIVPYSLTAKHRLTPLYRTPLRSD